MLESLCKTKKGIGLLALLVIIASLGIIMSALSRWQTVFISRFNRAGLESKLEMEALALSYWQNLEKTTSDVLFDLDDRTEDTGKHTITVTRGSTGAWVAGACQSREPSEDEQGCLQLHINVKDKVTGEKYVLSRLKILDPGASGGRGVTFDFTHAKYVYARHLPKKIVSDKAEFCPAYYYLGYICQGYYDEDSGYCPENKRVPKCIYGDYENGYHYTDPTNTTYTTQSIVDSSVISNVSEGESLGFTAKKNGMYHLVFYSNEYVGLRVNGKYMLQWQYPMASSPLPRIQMPLFLNEGDEIMLGLHSKEWVTYPLYVIFAPYKEPKK